MKIKKEYKKPEMEVYEMKAESQLLAGSARSVYNDESGDNEYGY